MHVPQHGKVRVGAGLGFHRAVEWDGAVLHQGDAPLRLAHLQLGHCQGETKEGEKRWGVNMEEKLTCLGRTQELSPSCTCGCACLGPTCTGLSEQKHLDVLSPKPFFFAFLLFLHPPTRSFQQETCFFHNFSSKILSFNSLWSKAPNVARRLHPNSNSLSLQRFSRHKGEFFDDGITQITAYTNELLSSFTENQFREE